AAPSSSACWAPCRAASVLPASSLTSSWTFGALNSASAISAALRIAWPASPALPPAEIGRMSAAFTSPTPTVPAGAPPGAPPGGGASVVCGGGGDVDWKKLELPVQPARNTPAVAIRPASERRRDSKAADGRTGNCAGTAVLLTAASASLPIGRRQSVILAANG